MGLYSLSLPDGIKTQDDKPFHGQVGGESLVFGFPLLGMTGLQKYSRVAARAVRPIEVGGDEKAWQTFVNHFLDGVRVVAELARDPSVQWTPVIGQAPQDLQEFCVDHMFPLLRLGDGADLTDRLA